MEEKSITPEGIINQAMGMNMAFTGAEFPVEIFPSKIQRIIHEVCECQSYPIDYTAAAILTAIAAGIGRVESAKPVISDRKNAKSSVFITRPFIPVIGTIQKNILNDLAKGDRSSNGFIDRILFVMPQIQRKARWNDKDAPDNLESE